MSEFLVPGFWVVAGLALLVYGGDLLVRSASALAVACKISPLVVGLTVVAFGTSAPELAVGVQAAFGGQSDLVVGNVVGSNIANILLILGLSATIGPLYVSGQLIRLEVPLMVGASIVMFLMALEGKFDRLDGAILFGSLICYTVWSIRQSRKETIRLEREDKEQNSRPTGLLTGLLFLQAVLLAVGCILLAVGSNWLVGGAVTIANLLGVSELIIGLTVVAFGTSLPEVVTSVVASIRGERDIAVGNIVGSNLFNILCVLGISSLVAPHGIDVPVAAIQFDIPVMIAVSIACLPVFFTGNMIARWEGAMFLGYYIAYMAYVVLAAAKAPVTPMLATVMVVFVIPLTVLTLGIAVVRTLRARIQANSTAEESNESS